MALASQNPVISIASTIFPYWTKKARIWKRSWGLCSTWESQRDTSSGKSTSNISATVDKMHKRAAISVTLASWINEEQIFVTTYFIVKRSSLRTSLSPASFALVASWSQGLLKLSLPQGGSERGEYDIIMWYLKKFTVELVVVDGCAGLIDSGFACSGGGFGWNNENFRWKTESFWGNEKIIEKRDHIVVDGRGTFSGVSGCSNILRGCILCCPFWGAFPLCEPLLPLFFLPIVGVKKTSLYQVRIFSESFIYNGVELSPPWFSLVRSGLRCLRPCRRFSRCFSCRPREVSKNFHLQVSCLLIELWHVSVWHLWQFDMCQVDIYDKFTIWSVVSG